MKDVLVVGGGITGLSAAYWLKKAGVNVVLCEQGDDVGGNIVSLDNQDFPFEQGPNSLLDNRELTQQLLEDLNLHPQIVEAADVAQERRVFVNHSLQQASPSPRHLFRILGLWGLLRLMLEPFIRVRRDGHEETIAQFFDRRLGHRARTRLVDAFVGGIYAGDSTTLSMDACFPQVLDAVRKEGSLFKAIRKKMGSSARAKTISFLKGMKQWPQALREQLSPELRTNTRVIAFEPLSSGGYNVQVNSAGHQERLEVEHVLLCTPAHEAAALLEGHWVRESREALLQIPYSHVATAGISWASSHPSSSKTKAFGFLAPANQGLRILGSVFASAIFPHLFPSNQTCINVFLGGARDPEILDFSDDEILAVVQKDLGLVLGEEPPLKLHGIKRWRKGIPQLTLGHKQRIDLIQKALTQSPRIHMAGNFLQGVSLHDAIASARIAVDSILDKLKKTG